MSKISVIVPLYNTEDYIERCIDSILIQTYSDLEIIVIDDGSTDHSGIIVDKLAAQDNRIKVIHVVNGGLVRARKIGVENATGKYIAFVDSDDTINQNMYEILYNEIEKSHADMVGCGYREVRQNETRMLCNKAVSGVYSGDILHELRKVMMYNLDRGGSEVWVAVWNKLFKKNILAQFINNIDERITIGEDAAITYEYMLRAGKVAIIDDCPYNYMIRSDSMCGSINYSVFEKLHYFRQYMLSRFQKLFIGI